MTCKFYILRCTRLNKQMSFDQTKEWAMVAQADMWFDTVVKQFSILMSLCSTSD